MNFNFTEEQLQFKNTLKSFLADECSTNSIRDGWTAKEPFNHDRWNKIADLGVLSSNLPEKDGGFGIDQVALSLMIEEMGYAALPEPVAEQIFLINDLIPLLPDSIKGEIKNTYQTGSNFISVAHPLSPNPLFLNNAAGLLLFNEDSYQFALTEDIDFIPLVSNDPSRGLSKINSIHKSVSSSKEFEKINTAVAARGALMTGCLLIGLAQKMLDLSSLYALDRTQFGKPIGSFQAIKHMLADVAVKIEFARPTIFRAAHSLLDNNPKFALHCAHAKYMSAKAAELACKNSIQAHGAMGYTWEMDLHIFMRKAWSLMACWGNEDKQQDIIYKTLTSSEEELGVLYTF